MNTRHGGRFSIGVLAGLIVAGGLAVATNGGIEQLSLAAATPTATPTPIGAALPGGAGAPTAVKPGGRQSPGSGQTAVPKGPGPAPSPAPGDIQFVRSTSETNTAREKSVEADCPSGTRLYGGGAQAVNGLGRVAIASARPQRIASTGIDRYSILAEERAPTGFTKAHLWSVEAYAVCGPTLPGYQIVNADNSEPGAQVSATATCPAGTTVIGVGGSGLGGFGGFSLPDIHPNAAHTAVTVTTADFLGDGPYAGELQTVASAICAERPAGYVVIEAQTSGVRGNPTLDISCPEGTSAWSAGVSVTDPTGQAYVDVLALDRENRLDPLPRVTRLAAHQSPVTQTVDLRGFAICAA